MITKNIPSVGSMLLSEPFMLDPNFQRAVVLLCEHDIEQGTVGLILNQPSNLLLKDAVGDFPEANFPLYLGGPVGLEGLQFIHNCYDRLNSGIEIGKGLYLGGNFEALKILINNKEIKDTEIKFFMGYSGWEPKQLDRELKENTWMIGNSYDPEIVYQTDPENLWRDAVISLGPKYAHVAGFPTNPSLN